MPTTPSQRSAFDILGLPPTADAQTIRKAWRALARTYHPDRYREDPAAATRKMAALNEAFSLLRSAGSPQPASQSDKPRRARPQPSTRHLALAVRQSDALRTAAAQMRPRAPEPPAREGSKADGTATRRALSGFAAAATLLDPTLPTTKTLALL